MKKNFFYHFLREVNISYPHGSHFHSSEVAYASHRPLLGANRATISGMKYSLSPHIIFHHDASSRIILHHISLTSIDVTSDTRKRKCVEPYKRTPPLFTLEQFSFYITEIHFSYFTFRKISSILTLLFTISFYTILYFIFYQVLLFHYIQ